MNDRSEVTNRSPRPNTSEHPTHLNLNDTPLSQQSSSVHRMNCRLQDAGRRTHDDKYLVPFEIGMQVLTSCT
jgi:hypothetical protein